MATQTSMLRHLVWLLLSLLLMACSGSSGDAPTSPAPPTNPPSPASRMLIVDSHIDLPSYLYEHPEDISQSVPDGQFDYPRAKAGGLSLAFLAIYVPASVVEAGDGKTRADALIDLVDKIVSQNPDKFALALTSAQAKSNFDAGKISFALDLENGGPIGNDIDNVQYFYNRGIRCVTLTASQSNQLADSSYGSAQNWHGLSPFGKQVVTEMNRLGMLVDVSHLSDAAFYDVIATSKTPVIASHSAARHFTPGFERNMSDDMLKALANNGGMISLIAGSAYLSEASRQSAIDRNNLVKAALQKANVDPGSAEADTIRAKIYSEHPFTYANIDNMLDEIDYLVNLIGVDHVGIGSAFDAVGDTLPVGFKDASAYANLQKALAARHYSDQDIQKIMGGNFLRIWQQVETWANQHG